MIRYSLSAAGRLRLNTFLREYHLLGHEVTPEEFEVFVKRVESGYGANPCKPFDSKLTEGMSNDGAAHEIRFTSWDFSKEYRDGRLIEVEFEQGDTDKFIPDCYTVTVTRPWWLAAEYLEPLLRHFGFTPIDSRPIYKTVFKWYTHSKDKDDVVHFVNCAIDTIRHWQR